MVNYAIVTGTRKLSMPSIVRDILTEMSPHTVIHGGALGVDTVAHQWCKVNGRCSFVYFPDWSSGKGAALTRNRSMVDDWKEYNPIVLAFPAPDSRGTRYTIDYALKAGLVVDIYELNPEQANG